MAETCSFPNPSTRVEGTKRSSATSKENPPRLGLAGPSSSSQSGFKKVEKKNPAPNNDFPRLYALIVITHVNRMTKRVRAESITAIPSSRLLEAFPSWQRADEI